MRQIGSLLVVGALLAMALVPVGARGEEQRQAAQARLSPRRRG